VFPAPLVRVYASLEEWKARRSGRPPLLTRGAFETASHGFRVDGSKAARELGLVYTPWEESLRQAIRWYWDAGLLESKPACGAD
jgi:hypothetical protein